MIQGFLRTLAVVATLCCATASPAKEKHAREVRHFNAGEAFTLRDDKAYLLLRIDTEAGKFTANILRVPGEDEMQAYDAAKQKAHAKKGKKAGPIAAFAFEYGGRTNFYELKSSKPFEKRDKMALVVAEVPPGQYVVYGQGHSGFHFQCLCLGTVGFDAKPGQVTDLGTMFIAKASEPSTIPELAEDTNLGRSAVTDYVLFAIALRPVRDSDFLPSGLTGLAATKRKPAHFKAVGPFLEANTMLINRLAPMLGVLDYKEGRVIDVPTGAEVPAHFSTPTLE